VALGSAGLLGVMLPTEVGGSALALQLPFCFEVGSLSNRLMSSTPE
jgi:hypothetical protein